MKFFMAIVCFLLLAGTANAQYLTGATVRYDARYYADFMFHRGGSEGHSGAYIQILAEIEGYSAITDINVKARHIASGFLVSLVGDDPSCIAVSPFGSDYIGFSVHLRPQDWWMTGKWKIILRYKEGGDDKRETTTVTVPRFNFPPEPTGIQISDWEEKTYLVWNRIGDPGTGPAKHVEYRISHYTASSPPCADEWYVIREGTNNYQLWSGNRIAFDLGLTDTVWASGDLIRIDNRVYDDNLPDGPNRNDRAVRFFFMP